MNRLGPVQEFLNAIKMFGERSKRNRRKSARGTKRTERLREVSVDDVYLDDFANAPSKDCVWKKISRKMTSSTSSFCLLHKLKSLEDVDDTAMTTDDDSLWYDRIDFGDSDNESSVIEHKKSSCTTTTMCKTESLQNTSWTKTGNCYPLDIWCILACYIKPEQIQTFACICRASHFAVSSVSFWSHLYKCFVTDTASLPARLKPDWIESRYGYKSRVVRALFISYKDFHNRLLQQTLQISRDTHMTSQLLGLLCCHVWYDHTKHFVFYFKFKRKQCEKVYEDDERLHYLTANIERDFIVFQVSVSNFIPLHSVSGECLTDISVNLSRNMRFHCIKMTFHNYRHDGRYRKGDGKMIIIDPVSEFRLLRWWHPSYPQCDE